MNNVHTITTMKDSQVISVNDSIDFTLLDRESSWPYNLLLLLITIFYGYTAHCAFIKKKNPRSIILHHVKGAVKCLQ